MGHRRTGEDRDRDGDERRDGEHTAAACRGCIGPNPCYVSRGCLLCGAVACAC